MPPSGAALEALVRSNVDSRMAAIRGYHPLSQRNPHYFIELCHAIGNGIIEAGPNINFTTADVGKGGTPMVAGVGTGVGIMIDSSFFVEDLYTRIRRFVLEDFGRTLHDPYPPRPGNSGQYLLALCEGIADAFLAYYPSAWTLTSSHPQVYMGTGVINDGHFSGLSSSAIQSAIISEAPDFIGRFWPRLARAVAESYVELIHNHSTGTVTITGTCIAGPTQVCDLDSSGTGSGVAA